MTTAYLEVSSQSHDERPDWSATLDLPNSAYDLMVMFNGDDIDIELSGTDHFGMSYVGWHDLDDLLKDAGYQREQNGPDDLQNWKQIEDGLWSVEIFAV